MAFSRKFLNLLNTNRLPPLHPIGPNRMNTTCYVRRAKSYEYHMLRTSSYGYKRLGRKFVTEYYWASMNGEVGATCRPLAASCTSGVYRYRILGIDDWKSRCNLLPCLQVAPPAFAALFARRIIIFRQESSTQPNSTARLNLRAANYVCQARN